MVPGLRSATGTGMGPPAGVDSALGVGLGALIAEGLQPAVPRGGEAEGARSGEGTPPGAALTEEERDVAEVRGGRRTKTIQDIVNTATEAGGREQGPE